MITRILALKNIGPFSNWEWPHHSEPGTLAPFGRVTLIAGDNGKGKTTIAAVLRSLEDNDPNAVLERRRAREGRGHHDFLAKVEHDGGRVCLSNESGWNDPRPTVFVFDDTFVSRNVYDGLVVGSKQREALHELVVGASGVQEARKAEAVRAKLSALKKDQKARELTLAEGFRCLTLQRVLRELPPENIEATLATLEQDLKRAAQLAPIQALPEFGTMPVLPELPLESVRALLETTVEQVEESAQKRVLEHLQALGTDAAGWVHNGLDLLSKDGNERCPFCGQELAESARSLIAAYRAHFNNEYQALQRRCLGLSEEIKGSIPETPGDSLARARQALADAYRQWSVHLPDLPPLTDLSELGALAPARRGLLAAVEQKRAAPLSLPTLTEETLHAVGAWQRLADQLRDLASVLEDLRERTRKFKADCGSLDESRLTQQQAELREWQRVGRGDFQLAVARYREAAGTISSLERSLEATKTALEKYQEEQFPKFCESINGHLDHFGATFHLREMTKTKGATGGERRADYVLESASTTVKVSASPKPGLPHFGSLLSAGDRRTLAFAFFLTTLEGKDLDGTTVVCDDPATSLDLDRRTGTVNELWGLAQRGAQLVVLSHFEPVLLELAARVSRTATSNRNAPLDVVSLRIDGARHDSRLVARKLDPRPRLARQREAICDFIDGKQINSQTIANQCRKLLEGIVQTCFPDHYLAGGCLKEFCERVQPLLESGRLDQPTFDEIRELRDFFNPESHFQEGAGPTGSELRTYAERLLRLAELRLGRVTA